MQPMACFSLGEILGVLSVALSVGGRDSKGHSLSDTCGKIVLKKGSHASVWGYNLQVPVRKIADPVVNYFSS